MLNATGKSLFRKEARHTLLHYSFCVRIHSELILDDQALWWKKEEFSLSVSVFIFHILIFSFCCSLPQRGIDTLAKADRWAYRRRIHALQKVHDRCGWEGFTCPGVQLIPLPPALTNALCRSIFQNLQHADLVLRMGVRDLTLCIMVQMKAYLAAFSGWT